MRNIQNIFIVLILIIFCDSFAFSQINNKIINSEQEIFSGPSTEFTTIKADIKTNSYYFFKVKKNHIYEWSTCDLNSFDTEISLYDKDAKIKYSFNDDYCGLQSQIKWKATFSGLVSIYVSEFNDNTKKPLVLKWREKSGGRPATGISVSPMGVMICGGGSETVTFTASGTCSGSYEYQVLDGGGTVVQPWSTTNNYVASPAATTTYTVEARCSTSPSTVVTDTFLVEMITEPAISGDTLICAGTNTTLTASGSTGDFEWWTEQTGGTQLDTVASHTSSMLTADTTYWVQANGITTTGAGSILITECGLEGAFGGSSEDYIEVSNLYTTPVNTNGWVVAISDSYSNINDINSDLWHLPNSFPPCSIVYRTDDSSNPNYWGSNIFWNSTSNSWAIVIDDVGNVVDFLVWGWTAADIAGFNTNINGFNITIGAEWIGDGWTLPCGTTGGVPFSIQRTGTFDSNTSADFVCDASTQGTLNPGLNCGWVATSCRFPVNVVVSDPAITTSVDSVSCNAGSDGEAEVTSVTGGYPSYSYNWSAGTPAGSTVSGLSAGTYSVTVQDSIQCEAIGNFTIEEPTAISLTLSSTPEVCGSCDGTATVTATGGTPGYSYEWPNGQTTATATNLCVGNYEVTVIDNNLCTATDTISVGTSGSATASFTYNGNQCLAGNSYEFTNTGTTGAGIIFSWDFGNNSNSTQENPTHTYSASGNYTVTFIVQDGPCTDTISDTITVYPMPEITSIDPVDVTCYQACDGTAQVNATNGTTPYSYQWDTNANNQTSPTAINLCDGTFSITLTDANSCTDIGNVTISEPTELVISLTGTDVTCNGFCDGDATVTVSGGTPSYSYLWSDGQQTATATDLCAGSYSVVVTDGNSCTATDNITINENPLLTGTTTQTNVSCNGLCDGEATVTASGGAAGMYSYEWSDQQTTATATGLCAGQYSVVITDQNLCEEIINVTITEPSEIVISAPDNISICQGSSTTINASVSGGTPPYYYYWDGVLGNSSYSVSPMADSSYSVFVTDINDCQSNTENIVVLVSPDVYFTVGSNTDSICPGDNAMIITNISGGVPPYNIYDDNTNDVVTSPIYVYPPNDFTYTYTVYDQCGTSASDSYTINLYDPPLNSFQAEPTAGCEPLEVNFQETNGIDGNTYQWNFGDYGQNNLSYTQNPTHIYNSSGKYTVTLIVTSPEGCQTPQTIDNMITVYPRPDAKFESDEEVVSVINPNVDFFNQSVGADSYTWIFGDNDTSNAVNPSHIFPVFPTGEYTTILIANTINGCKDTAKQKIVIQDEHTFYAPSAFTPNNDMTNDFFRVYSNAIDETNFKLFVFDRWGEIIFETDDYNEVWDGSVKGKDIAKSGVYTWLAVYKDFQGIEHEETGAVTVIR